MKIIDFMPYIVRMDFNGTELVSKKDAFHIYKNYEQK